MPLIRTYWDLYLEIYECILIYLSKKKNTNKEYFNGTCYPCVMINWKNTYNYDFFFFFTNTGELNMYKQD